MNNFTNKTSKFKWILFFIAVIIVIYMISIGRSKETKNTTLNSSLKGIQERGELRIGIDPGFMPFDMKNSKGEIFGFDAEMMKAFSKFLGVQARFVETQWLSLTSELLSGKIDAIASGFTITEKRKSIVLFSTPYFVEPVGALISKNNPAGILNSKDIKKDKTRVAVKLGTTPDLYYTELGGYNIIRFDSETAAASAVIQKKADVFVFDQMFLEIFHHKYKKKDDIIILKNFLPGESLGVAFSPKNPDLAAEFNKFLSSWKESQDWKKAIKTYFQSFDWINNHIGNNL